MEDKNIEIDCRDIFDEVLVKRRWLPVISKQRAKNLLLDLSKRWQNKVNELRAIDRENIRMEHNSRQAEHYKLLKNSKRVLALLIEEHRYMMLESSKVAFCTSECGMAKVMTCEGVCPRKKRYIEYLEEHCNSLTSDDFESTLTKEERDLWRVLQNEDL